MQEEQATDTRITTHFPDDLRVSVLSGAEEARYHFVPHLMQCPDCQERLADFVERLEGIAGDAGISDCERARSAALQFLDRGKPVLGDDLTHIAGCDDCNLLFMEPALALRVRESGGTGRAG